MKRPISKVVKCLDQGLQPSLPPQPKLSQSDSLPDSFRVRAERLDGVCSPPVTEPIAYYLGAGNTTYLWERIELPPILMGPEARVQMVTPISCV